MEKTIKIAATDPTGNQSPASTKFPQFSETRCSTSPFREVFEQISDICLWIDSVTGCVMDCNAALQSLLYYAPLEIIGQHVCTLAPASDLADRSNVWQILEHGGDFANQAVNFLSKTGFVIRMNASSFPMPDSVTNTDRRLVILRNMTIGCPCIATTVNAPKSSRSLAFEIAAAEARERQRIANGLHDEIGQILAIIGFKLGALGEKSSTTNISPEIDEVRALISQASRATRTATFELSCPLLQHLGLQSAIEGLAERINGVSGLTVHVEGQLPKVLAPEPVLSVLFRVIRELLMNVLKHAHAKNVWIKMQSGKDEIKFIVVDDGIGIHQQAMLRDFGPGGGFGLLNAETQMQAIGGRFVLESAGFPGTRAELILPIASE